MKSRLLVAAVGVPLLLWVILWAPEAVLVAMLAALSSLAAWELMKCVGAAKFVPLLAVTALGASISILSAARQEILWYVSLGVLELFVFVYAVYKAGEVKFLHVCASMFSILAIPYAFSSFLRLSEAGLHRSFLLLPLIFSFASDTGAYFVGCAFGKHKLAPKVSPNKTVEGSIGGLLGNAIGGMIFALVVNIWLDQSISYSMIAVLGVICSVVAQLGDLCFSLIKREFGIKDYGKIFLAHGGVLDRFDSLLFVAPVLAAAMIWLA